MHNPNFKELKTWHSAMKLTTFVYKMTNLLPKSEIYGLSDQIRRSAVSVPSNIAEGCGRESLKDYIHFLYISRGSLFELETQLELCKALEFINEEELLPIMDLLYSTKKMLSKLITFNKGKL